MAATNHDPLWENASAGAPSYTANELRTAHALLLQFNGRLVGGRAGVRPGGDQLKVSFANPTITIQPGVACVDPGLTTTQGPYWVSILTTDTHTLTAADATNPRKDIVILRVYDHDEDASGNRFARTEYLTGVAAPSPVEPALPQGSIKLALLDVPASPGAVVVTDTRVDAFAGPEMVVFTASGSFVKANFLWARRARVRCQAGGGAGGGCAATAAGEAAEGGGGAGGGYVEEWLDIRALATSETVTVGAGGTGVSGAAGNAGGDSSFGSQMTATGGPGGSNGPATSTSALAAGGIAAAGTGAPVAASGSDGGTGRVISASPVFANYGGSSPMGGLGRPSISASADGLAGNNYGGGGSGAHNGASQAARTGGAGAAGIVIVELY